MRTHPTPLELDSCVVRRTSSWTEASGQTPVSLGLLIGPARQTLRMPSPPRVAGPSMELFRSRYVDLFTLRTSGLSWSRGQSRDCWWLRQLYRDNFCFDLVVFRTLSYTIPSPDSSIDVSYHGDDMVRRYLHVGSFETPAAATEGSRIWGLARWIQIISEGQGLKKHLPLSYSTDRNTPAV